MDPQEKTLNDDQDALEEERARRTAEEVDSKRQARIARFEASLETYQVVIRRVEGETPEMRYERMLKNSHDTIAAILARKAAEKADPTRQARLAEIKVSLKAHSDLMEADLEKRLIENPDVVWDPQITCTLQKSCLESTMPK